MIMAIASIQNCFKINVNESTHNCFFFTSKKVKFYF